MKVVHLVSGDFNGGAARGAYWLHLGLREKGIDSKILTNSLNAPSDEHVVSLARTPVDYGFIRLRSFADSSIANVYRNRTRDFFSVGWFGENVTREKVFQEADMVHLHWINMGLLSIDSLSRIRKPLVWTLRDMWPFTGGCHYAVGCDKYRTLCGACPQLGSRRNLDLSRVIQRRKIKRYPKDIQLVGISEWISQCARQSTVFRDYKIQTIYNNINLDHFFPLPSQTSREALGLDEEKPIVLVGAQFFDDTYKGFDLCVDTLNRLSHGVLVVFFGGKFDNTMVEGLRHDYVNLGFLNDTVSMRLAYSAADVFVSFSKMEAFGKTLAESMACGTPVACFDVAGPKEIVTHRVDGYKAVPYDTVDLATGIEWILQEAKAPGATLSRDAVRNASRRFSSARIAEQYVELYQRIV